MLSAWCVINDMNEALLAPYSEDEVRKALFAIGDLKALGQDNLHAIFLPSGWLFVGPGRIAIKWGLDPAVAMHPPVARGTCLLRSRSRRQQHRPSNHGIGPMSQWRRALIPRPTVPAGRVKACLATEEQPTEDKAAGDIRARILTKRQARASACACARDGANPGRLCAWQPASQKGGGDRCRIRHLQRRADPPEHLCRLRVYLRALQSLPTKQRQGRQWVNILYGPILAS